MLTSRNVAKVTIILGLALVLMAFMWPGAGAPTPTQRGEVTVTLDENGVALQRVDFPRAFRAAPVVVVTPRGEQGFVVTSFFADAFEGGYFALGAKGQPGAVVRFYWMAMEK